MASLPVTLEQLQAEVADLEEQKADLSKTINILNRDITGLKSKKLFYKNVTVQLEKAKVDVQVKYDLRFTELQATEAEIEEKIAAALEDLEAINRQAQLAESELETLEQQHEQEVIGHQKRLLSIKNEVKAVEALKADATQQIVDINKQLVVKQINLDKLVDRIKQAEIDGEAQIDEIDQTVKTAKLKINEINRQIDHKVEQYDDLGARVEQEQTKLDSITVKHAEFLAYEKRADMALKARESALLQGEANLSQVRRRSGVLDNI